MREQSRQVDQERWRLSQEESRLKALQSALEDERRITLEQLSSQRTEVYLQNLISPLMSICCQADRLWETRKSCCLDTKFSELT